MAGLVGSLSAVFVVMLVVLNVLMHFVILKPIQEISVLTRDVSAGKTDTSLSRLMSAAAGSPRDRPGPADRADPG